MFSIFITAFLMGMIGSFHCVGMCGPLALSLPLHGFNSISRFFGLLLYNLGRVVTYSFLGLLIGLFGNSLKMAGLQQWLSILAGLVILIYLLYIKFGIFGSSNYFSSFFEIVRKKLGELYFKKSLGTVFLIGILNGFLPCGFVYLAFAGAIATGDAAGSIVFMAAFGLGTIPMMWSVSFLGNYFGVSFSRKIKKLYPYAMLLVSCLLIIRGLSLGIPYLSPVIEIKNGVVHSCCHK